MGSFFQNIDLASKLMTARVSAHEVYSSNVANASTSGYKAQVPSFEVKLDQARLMAERQGEVPGEALMGGARFLGEASASAWDVEAKSVPSKEPVNKNGNNVNMEKELVSMSENSVMYLTTLKILSKEIALTKYAITAGGR